MSGEGVIADASPLPCADLRDLRRSGLALEVAAGAFNATAARCEAGQSPMDVFGIAIEQHGFARDNFRDALERVTGTPAAVIERWLAL